MSKPKKIIIWVIILIIVALAGFFILNSNERNVADNNNPGFSLKNFFPFGNPDEVNFENISTEEEVGGEELPPNNPESLPKLRKISEEPVAGAVIVGTGSSTHVRFVHKSTGNVYEAYADRAGIARLTNTTIPKLSRATWLENGTGFIAQKVGENGLIETSFIQLKSVSASSTAEIGPSFEPVISKLPSGIREIAINPTGNRIFYYVTNGSAEGYISNLDGTNPTFVFEHALSEWLPQWTSKGIILSTKPSFGVNSYSYLLDTQTERISKIAGPQSGASVLADVAGVNLLISKGGTMDMVLIKAGTETDLVGRTITDKCVWMNDEYAVICGMPKTSGSGTHPDSWYQGLLSTDDVIQKINLEENSLFILSIPEESVDTDQMQIGGDDEFVIFTNRTDGSLWLLSI